MSGGRLRTACVLAMVAALFVAGPACADGGASRPDALGDAGAVPDIVGLDVSVEGSKLTLAVDFGDEPPLTWSGSPDAGYTDVLAVFVDGDSGGFLVSLWARNGSEGAWFAPFVDGSVEAQEPGVVVAQVDGAHRTGATTLP